MATQCLLLGADGPLSVLPVVKVAPSSTLVTRSPGHRVVAPVIAPKQPPAGAGVGSVFRVTRDSPIKVFQRPVVGCLRKFFRLPPWADPLFFRDSE